MKDDDAGHASDERVTKIDRDGDDREKILGFYGLPFVATSYVLDSFSCR